MKRIYLISLALLFSYSINAQNCSEIWLDYGNGIKNMELADISSQDKKLSKDDFSFISATPLIPKLEGVNMHKAFKFTKNAKSTSGFPSVTFQFKNNLESKKIEDILLVNFEVKIYVSVNLEMDGLDLSTVPKEQRKIVFIIDGDAVKRRYKICHLKDFKPGWQTLKGTIKVDKEDASNINEYTQFKIVFGKPLAGHSNGKKYYTVTENPSSDSDYLAEKIDFYIASIKSNIKIK
ncbi:MULTISPECIES: hypothetical protein [Flavobacteriaceae]|uniref:hypothetical protein n=1 Tax=Flavobacteriaceae TaxID=49546 RepID=UPI00131A6615|nr:MULTISPECIES: hypothetical protein [Flavobacteriaceae]MDO7173686.1 hypothetical protein [Mariniflexile sp. AS56]